MIFEAGERPVTIAGALVFTDPKQAKDWLARPSGNVLILQPLRAVEPSVLFVRTIAADGQERHYSFELRTREGSVADTTDPEAYMTVRITYPVIPRQRISRRLGVGAQATAERAMQARFTLTDEVGPRNYNYDKRDPVGCPFAGADERFRRRHADNTDVRTTRRAARNLRRQPGWQGSGGHDRQ